MRELVTRQTAGASQPELAGRGTCWRFLADDRHGLSILVLRSRFNSSGGGRPAWHLRCRAGGKIMLQPRWLLGISRFARKSDVPPAVSLGRHVPTKRIGPFYVDSRTGQKRTCMYGADKGISEETCTNTSTMDLTLGVSHHWVKFIDLFRHASYHPYFYECSRCALVSAPCKISFPNYMLLIPAIFTSVHLLSLEPVSISTR